MLDLPNGRPLFGDIEQLCDWVELSTLVSSSGAVSVEQATDVLRDSLLFEEAVKKRRRRQRKRDDDLEADEQAQHVEDTWRRLASRSEQLGEGYPFVVEKHGLSRKTNSWRDSRCFTLLMIADLGKAYKDVRVDFQPGSHFCRLFEKVVEASQKLLFRGTTVRFGHPPDESWPTPVKDRIEHLAERFERNVEDLEEKIHGRDKDLGLDVASRLALGDEGDGLLTILTQCATGENWTTKYEPSLDEWKALIRWKSVVVRAIAFPWRQQQDRFAWRDALRLDAMVLDRMRLLAAGNPDKHLDALVTPEIEAWCIDRLGEFPQLGRTLLSA